MWYISWPKANTVSYPKQLNLQMYLNFLWLEVVKLWTVMHYFALVMSIFIPFIWCSCTSFINFTQVTFRLGNKRVFLWGMKSFILSCPFLGTEKCMLLLCCPLLYFSCNIHVRRYPTYKIFEKYTCLWWLLAGYCLLFLYFIFPLLCTLMLWVRISIRARCTMW